MLKEILANQFKSCEPEVQRILLEVIELEWENLSFKNPQLSKDVRQIIEDVEKG